MSEQDETNDIDLVYEDGDFGETESAGGGSGFPPTSETLPLQESPLEAVANGGKDPLSGRFLAGNRLGRGNPVAKQTSRLRKAMCNAVTPEDLQEVVRSLVTKAKAGDTAAAKILLNQLLGPPTALDVLAVVAKLEGIVFKGKI